MIKLQNNEKIEFEEEKNPEAECCYNRSKNDCSKESKPIVVMLDRFDDWPLVIWSTITNQYQNFLRNSDMSSIIEQMNEEESDIS